MDPSRSSSLDKESVLESLRTLRDQSSGRSLIELGAVKKVAACDGHVSLTLGLPADETLRANIRRGVEESLRERAARLGTTLVQLHVEFVAPSAPADATMPATMNQPEGVPMKQGASSPSAGAVGGPTTVKSGSPSMPGVRHVIAVGAGKGGVGKSTISVNLAVALARAGHAVGLLDGDIYGPSIPTLLGLHGKDVHMLRNMLQPFYVHGIKTMTIGKLVDAEKPLIWRGPMAHGAFKQLAEQTEWGELDYMIVDLPPGTGDVSLTMAQMLSVTGAVVVCTPQRVAQDDAVRAARMFQTLGIEVLGVVENMSYFIGDDAKEYDLFGRGGAEQMAQRLGLPFLGAVPIHMDLRVNSDAGNPTANFSANPSLATSLERMARRVEQEVALAAMRKGGGPVLRVS